MGAACASRAVTPGRLDVRGCLSRWALASTGGTLDRFLRRVFAAGAVPEMRGEPAHQPCDLPQAGHDCGAEASPDHEVEEVHAPGIGIPAASLEVCTGGRPGHVKERRN